MNQNIYIKLDRNNEVGSREVTIGDVASIYCTDSTVVNKLTPIEVEMNNYEQDLDYALIERGGRSGKEEDVQ